MKPQCHYCELSPCKKRKTVEGVQLEEGEIVVDGGASPISSPASTVTLFPDSPPCSAWTGEDQEGLLEQRLEAVLGGFRMQLLVGPIDAQHPGTLFGGYGSFLCPPPEAPLHGRRRLPSEKEAAMAGLARPCNASAGRSTQVQAGGHTQGRPLGGGQINPEDPQRATLAAARLAFARRRKKERRPAGSKGVSLAVISPASGGPLSAQGPSLLSTAASRGKGDAGFDQRLEAVLGDCRRRFEGGPVDAESLGTMFGDYGFFLCSPQSEEYREAPLRGIRRLPSKKEAAMAGRVWPCNPSADCTRVQAGAHPQERPPGGGQSIVEDPLRVALAAAHLALARRGKKNFPDQHPPASSKGDPSALISPASGAQGCSVSVGREDGVLDQRLEAVLGDCRRQFEVGPIDAGSLGATFGAYGTFLLNVQ